MEIKDLCVEYLENPIGLDIVKPRFSWKINSKEKNVVQTAYRILVMNEGKTVWDTKVVQSSNSLLIKYDGDELKESSIYEVFLEVWDNKENQDSVQGSFEMGLLKGSNFIAGFITHELPAEETACPIFFREFGIKKEIKRARIYATALGVYEIKINNSKIDDSYFAPGWTNYKKRLQYQTYDVTNNLKENNKIEVTVGNGWYKGMFGLKCIPNIYGDKVALLFELHIWYGDGTKEVIISDNDWKVTTGNIISSEIYMGEIIDTCFAKAKTSKVVSLEFDKNRLVSQECELVRITERISAKEHIMSQKGENIIDFGQNISGIVEVKVKGEKGSKVVIKHAEVLDKEGNFYTENLRTAEATNTYILNGEEQVFLPHFTFHGFRYICVEGIDNIILDNFTACVMHTDLIKTGDFSCSHPLINRLYENIFWGQRDNFLDIPTDCPQRNERLGWTGDAQVFAKTAAYNQNVALFFKKWLHDLSSEQTKEMGVPRIVPDIFFNQEGVSAWGDVATIIPWRMYEAYGDISFLEEQYESMKGWIDYITDRCSDNGLWQSGFQYGDWLALDKEEGSDRIGATDVYLIANAFYLYSMDILIKSAKLIGNNDDVKVYSNLYDTVLKTFRKEYYTDTGRIVSETQTGCILSLYFNLAEDKHKERIIQSLKTNIERHKNHLTTGFVGTPYLCHALSENGLHDLSGILLLNDDFPSWLYQVKMGATTVWERWNSILPNGDFDVSGMNSLNHYAYGSIGDWLYGKLVGINPLEPGYKKIEIKPMPIDGIDWVKGAYESVYGKIESSWSYNGIKMILDVVIPTNTTARIHIWGNEEVIEVGSGTYHFE